MNEGHNLYAKNSLHFSGKVFSALFKEFKGNSDMSSIVYHDISPAITARFIRVHPTDWSAHISMRVEFYGCSY